MQNNQAFQPSLEREKITIVAVVASIAAIAGILFGFDTGVISGAILFIRSDFQLTSFTNGLVVSAVLFGALSGSLVSGRFTDYFGRRYLLIFSSLLFLLGTIGSAFAPTAYWLVISRIIVGFAIGIASFVAPLYISEVSPRKYRGALVSLNQLAITVGIMLSYLVDYYYAPSGHWRLMLAFGVIPAVILFFGMLFLPCSPRWMMLRGFEDKARAILMKLRGNTESVNNEIGEIKESLSEQHGGWRILLQPWLRPAILVGFGLSIAQQVTGINTIIYYAPTILELAGFQTATTAILATFGIGVINVLFTIISLFLIDRWGRRPLLLIGLVGMIISLTFVGIAFLDHGKGGAVTQWGAFISMLLYIMSFAISLGPIVWLMISEIFPIKIRGLASSIATSVNWLANMIVAMVFLTLVQWLKPEGTFFLFAIISVISWIFVYFKVPETKQISLEHIEQNLHAGKSSRYLGA